MSKRKQLGGSIQAGVPSSPCKWRQDNSTRAIYRALGFGPGSKIPRDFHGEFKIDGWNVVVKRSRTSAGAAGMYSPKQKKQPHDHSYFRRGKARSAEHRIFVRHEGRLIPAGRVYQALCTPYKRRVVRHKIARRK